MKYGAVEIEYEIREIANPQTLAEQRDILDRQTAQLNKQQDDFAENWIARMKDRNLRPTDATQKQRSFKPADAGDKQD